MYCRALGKKEVELHIMYIHWVFPYFLDIFRISNKGLDWAATRLTLAQRSGSALQYNETLAWSRKGSWLVDCSVINMTFIKGKKKKKPRLKKMELTVPLQMCIPSWAQIPDHPHPLFLASQKSTERTQQQAWALNERNVFRGKFYHKQCQRQWWHLVDDETHGLMENKK